MYYGQDSGLSYKVEDGMTIVKIRLPLEKTREGIDEQSSNS
jgi:hypothetical protein